jgi:hypothetical protein
MDAPKSPGQRAYEEDVRRRPLHHDGSPRRPWSVISDVAKWSWERDPSPRDWSQGTKVATPEDHQSIATPE